MLFWLITVVLTALVALLVLRPLFAETGVETVRSQDIDIYRGQLAELDRDLARGVIETAEAERAATEIKRRILSADRMVKTPVSAPAGPDRRLPIALSVLTLAVGFYGYWSMGSPGLPDQPRAARLEQAAVLAANRGTQEEMEVAFAASPNLPTLLDIAPEYVTLVDELRRVIDERPDDLQGWELLALHEARIGNFTNSRIAQGHVLRLKGDAATAADRLGWLDRAIAATGGLVSPEAQMLIEALRQESPGWGPPDYYLGLHYAQIGRTDLAFNLWRRVIEGNEPNSPYVQFARDQIEDAAYLAGVEYALPDLPGPTAAEVAASADMSDEDRQAMIRGMVSQLSERLASEGGTPEEWARLISALGVLGETEQAAAIWDEAKQVFGASPEALGPIARAAQQAGVQE